MPLAIAMVAVLLPAGPAAARPVALHVRGVALSPGPSLGPAGVLWAEGDPDYRSMRFRSGDARASKTLADVPSTLFAENDSLDTYGIAASTTRVAFSEEFFEYDGGEGVASQGFAVLRAGRPAGPYPTLVGDTRGTHVVEGFRLSGDALVTDEILANVSRVLVRDLATRAPPRQLGPDGASHGRIAGSYAAYTLPAAKDDTATTIVVADRVTGAEVYRVAVPFKAGRGVVDMALQDDGTVAIVAPASTRTLAGNLAWASRDDPALHVVRHDATSSDPGDPIFVVAGYPHHKDAIVRIARNRIVYLRANGQLALAGIADAVVRAVSFSDEIVGADFDGTRLAYATPHCVYMDTVKGPAPTAPPVGTCPQLDLAASFFEQPGRSILKARVECTSRWEKVCRGSAVFRTAETGVRSLKIATLRFSVRAGKARTLQLKLSRAQRTKLLAYDRRSHFGYRFGSVAVAMIATVTDKGHVKTVARADEGFRF